MWRGRGVKRGGGVGLSDWGLGLGGLKERRVQIAMLSRVHRGSVGGGGGSGEAGD